MRKLLLALALLPSMASAEMRFITDNTFSVDPVSVLVIDGDTFKVDKTRVRINGIDAPEMTQDGGMKARAVMKWYVMRAGQITCRVAKKDRWGRWLATCLNIHGADLADLIVRDGWAFAYRQYSKNYILAENEAKRNKRGLWQGEFEYPWDYRSRRRR